MVHDKVVLKTYVTIKIQISAAHSGKLSNTLQMIILETQWMYLMADKIIWAAEERED